MPSSVIRRFDYDADSRTLKIDFVSGAAYAYRDVPPPVAHGLREAGSKGRYFSQRIRDRYAFERLGRD